MTGPENPIRSSRIFTQAEYCIDPTTEVGTKVTGIRTSKNVGSVLDSFLQARYGLGGDRLSFFSPLPTGSEMALKNGVIEPTEIPAIKLAFARPMLTDTRVDEFSLQIVHPGEIRRPYNRTPSRARTESAFMLRAWLQASYRGRERLIPMRLTMGFALYHDAQQDNLILADGQIIDLEKVAQSASITLGHLKAVKRGSGNHSSNRHNEREEMRRIMGTKGRPVQGGAPDSNRRRH